MTARDPGQTSPGKGAINAPARAGNCRLAAFSFSAFILALFLAEFYSGAGAAASTVYECDRLASFDGDMERVAPWVPLNRIDKARAVAACKKAVEQEPQNPRLLLQLGYLLILNGNKAAGRDYLQRAANMKYAAAEYLLGVWIEDKTLPRDNLSDPETLFERSAARGNPFAMYNLALHALGKPDREEAVKWAKKAAANGLPEGEFNLAYVILQSRPIGKETEWATAVMEREIAAGNLQANFTLALILWNEGPRVLKGRLGYVNERAYELMKSAADKGYAPAKNYLKWFKK